jgi:hypothetical protein
LPNIGNERSRGGMLLAQRECGWLQQRHRQRRVKAAGSGEQDAEASIGMPHQVRAIAHEIGDVFAITQKVFTVGGRASPITTPVEHHQSTASIREWPLCLPLLDSCCQ